VGAGRLIAIEGRAQPVVAKAEGMDDLGRRLISPVLAATYRPSWVAIGTPTWKSSTRVGWAKATIQAANGGAASC
jgi:hypothetical protein